MPQKKIIILLIVIHTNQPKSKSKYRQLQIETRLIKGKQNIEYYVIKTSTKLLSKASKTKNYCLRNFFFFSKASIIVLPGSAWGTEFRRGTELRVESQPWLFPSTSSRKTPQPHDPCPGSTW